MKQFEYSQQLQHLKMTVDEIHNMLDNKPIQYAYIIHDKDDTEPHIHVMVKLMNSDMTADMVCKWFKDKPQYINIKKSRWENKLSYLCHRTPEDKDKFQYNPSEVVANFDYVKKLDDITKQVKSYTDIENIIEEIQNGSIREYNLTEYVNAHTFSKHKNRIIAALEWYRRKIMTDKNRDIKVIAFTGETGTGKTTYAKDMCSNQGKTYCVSSSSNDPMQDYKGEDVLILDDIRDSTFKFSDLLKVLDNHTNSTVASRYNNKAFIGDTIIITSAVGIKNWYRESKDDEEKAQLYRRITEWYAFTKDYINCFRYNEKKKDYEFMFQIPNLIKQKYKDTKISMLDTLNAMGVKLSDDMRKAFLEPSENDDKTVEELMKEMPF